MRAMVNDLYDTAFKYDETVFLALASTKENGSWTNFIYDIFIDIAFLAAAATAVATGGAGLVPAFAFLSAILHDWGLGKDTPDGITGLNGFFAEYQAGQIAMQTAIDTKLGYLADVSDNYSNLQAEWENNSVVVNDQTYTLMDLANTFFPDKTDHSVEYHKLYDPMYLHHRKSVWNLAIMKCCTYYRYWAQYTDTPRTPAGRFLDYMRNVHYKSLVPGCYVRGEIYWLYDDKITWRFYQYNLGIGGYPFPEAACHELFMDDTPGHIINPAGLFNRSYVFEQFSVTKPVFPYGMELGNDTIGNFNPAANDWTFTGGLFPKLTK